MEWKKVLQRKGIIGILLILWLFALFFYGYSFQQHQQDKIGLKVSFASQEEYETYFYEKIEALVVQADAMGGISIFAEPDSFSSSNLQQTKADYIGLLEITPIYFQADYIEDFLAFSLLNGIVVIAGVLVALALVDEKKRGIRKIIFACERGRCYLVVRKIGALCLWSILLVVVYYGSCLILSSVLHGENIVRHLSYPLQSVPILMELPWCIDIGIFFVVYLAYRSIVLFLIMLLAWTMLFFFENVILSLGVIGGIGLFNCLIYHMIGSIHPWNVLHYCNLWYQMSDVTFFTEYKNLNIWDEAVNKEVIITFSWWVLAGVLILVDILIGRYKYPCSSSYDGRLVKTTKAFLKYIQRSYRKRIEKLSILGTEFYKVLVTQKGIVVVLVVCFVLWIDTDYTQIMTTGYQDLYYDFLEKHEGVPTEASYHVIEEIATLLQKVEDDYIEAMERYENGEIDSLLSWSMLYDSYENERIFLKEITAQTKYLEDMKASGIQAGYINTYAYNSFLNNGDTLINVVLILGVVLLSSGVFSMENKNGIGSVVRSTICGRDKLFGKKVIVALSLAMLLFATSVVLEWSALFSIYEMGGWNLPIQSIPSFGFMPIRCSIGTFLILMYLLKGLMIGTVAMFTCWLTMKTNQKFAVVLSLGLCIPELLTLSGMWIFQYVSIVRVLSIAPFLLQVQSIEFVFIVSGLLISIGIWSGWRLYKKWCNR